MKLLIVALLFIPHLLSAQNVKPDSTKRDSIPQKDWLRDRAEFGVNLGGGQYGFGFGIVLRYWYIGATIGVTKLGDVEGKPSDIKQYAPPHGDYTNYGFKSGLISITGDVSIPIASRLALKLSAGANEQAISYVSRSNVTGWWYISDKKDTSLGMDFVGGGGLQWNVWKQMVIGAGYVSSFGAYVNIGGVL